MIFAAVLVAHDHDTTITFAAVMFAAYSAMLYSRFRWAALLAVGTGAVIVTAAFPNTTPQVPARFTALLVLVPTAAVAVAMRGWRQRAGDSAERLLRAEAEHEAQTRRAVEAERARIAERAARRGDAQRERDGGAGGRGPQRARPARRTRPGRPCSRSRPAAGPR